MTAHRVSLVLLAFNQRELLPAAVAACLAQEGEPLEIVLSDDASTDGSFELLQALAAGYRGPHQVRVRRNPRNLGIGAHYNAVLDDTQGELIVTAAGDDISVPHRVHRLVTAWMANGCQADLLASHFFDMAPDGTPGAAVTVDDLAAWTLARWLQQRPFTTGATHAFTRRMMRRFGPFVDDLWYEDTVMVFRALGMGGALTVPEPLVHYRRDGTSNHPVAAAAITGERLRAWRERQNRRLLAETRQLMQDAAALDQAAAVAAALAPTLQRESFMHQAMAAGDLHARWQALRAAPTLPLAWRLRKLLFFAAPAAAAMSAALRRWRQRVRAR